MSDRNSRRLRIAFAGSINSGGYARLLRLVSDCLNSEDELAVFGPHNAASLAVWKIRAVNGGLLRPNELLRRLRDDFDVLYVPMSFDGEGHADNMRLSFPSKLADYTAVGLPLLICGPKYSSAIRWARENAPMAEVVTSESRSELMEALLRLRSPEHRDELGRRALHIGENLFSYERAQSVFYGALNYLGAS